MLNKSDGYIIKTDLPYLIEDPSNDRSETTIISSAYYLFTTVVNSVTSYSGKTAP